MKKKLPVNITKKALKKILEIKKQKKIDDAYHLRLGVKPAGCGIASHMIGFDHPTAKDEVFELDGIQVIIEKIQLMHLAGKSVDYDVVDGEAGFLFRTDN